MAENQYVNRVVFGNQIVIDISDSTVNANTLLAGYKAYGANGEQVTGNVTLSYHITLTQAQYNELSDQEKLADENFFYITDADPSSVQFIDDTQILNSKGWSSDKISKVISNPNLFDNPWFTINQRGFVDTPINNYTVDRWRTRNTTLVSLSNGIITVTHNRSDGSTWFGQPLEHDYANFLVGKTVTLSILTGNDTLESWTFVVPNVGTSIDLPTKTVDGTKCFFKWEYTQSAICPYLWMPSSEYQKTLTLKAVKLEIGSISTLAMDTAPNYATELLKCQRYFVRINGGANNNGILTSGGFTVSATQMRGQIPLPAQMRTTPAITTGGSIRVGKPSGTIATASQITSYSVASLSPTFVNIIANTSVNMDVDIIANLHCSSDATAHIDLSADL